MKVSEWINEHIPNEVDWEDIHSTNRLEGLLSSRRVILGRREKRYITLGMFDQLYHPPPPADSAMQSLIEETVDRIVSHVRETGQMPVLTVNGEPVPELTVPGPLNFIVDDPGLGN